MTPEDAGIAAYHKSIDSALPATDLSHSMFIIGNAVYNAIRAAVEAEREACAQVAEELTKQRAAEMGTPYDHLTGWRAAQAIRARSRVTAA